MEFIVEEMAGQRLMLGFDGQTLNPELKALIRDLKAGGIILFRPNIETPDQLKQLCRDARNFALDCGLPDLFIAVDQEGGEVARLRKPFTEFPGNPHIRTPEEAERFVRAAAGELNDMGINMNMAPVMDVIPPGVDSIMKNRAFPGDETLVARLGTIVIRGFQDRGVMAVAKHFPGIGRTVKDSHFFLPVLDADEETLWRTDIRPFQAAVSAGVSGMMLSHISYPRLDNTWQASLSPAIARDLLRKDLGYQGLTMTDDLDMKAVSLDIEVCIRQILAAEIDLALICHSGPNIRRARDELVRLMGADEAMHELGRASMERILSAKKRFLEKHS